MRFNAGSSRWIKMYNHIQLPIKGKIYQSVRGQRRIVIDIIDDQIIYRTIGKMTTNRVTHIAIWESWCKENFAFVSEV